MIDMKLRFFMLLMLSGLFMTGCDYIQDIIGSIDEGGIRPEVNDVKFSCKGGERTVKVEADFSWEVECDAYWCNISGSYGNKGTSELVISVYENTSAESRIATITLKNGYKDVFEQIYVEQEGAAPTMGDTVKELTVGSDGGDFLVDLKTNMQYRADADADWLYAEPDSDGEYLRVTVYEIYEDFTESQRTATISIYEDNYGADYAESEPLRTINVIQKNMSFRIEFTCATDYVPFNMDHLGADVIAIHNYQGEGYVDFDGPITVGDSQFYYSPDLISIKIPDCVTEIGESAFCDCSALESVTLPETITSIGASAFASCIALQEIVLPDSVTEIGDWAFSGCKGLGTARLGEGLKTIGEGAFYNCETLVGILIPGSVTVVGQKAFVGCESLEYFYGDYATEDGRCLVIDGEIKGFAPCAETKYYSIPSGITSVGPWTFAHCENLRQIIMGADVVEVKDHAFYYSSLDNDRIGLSLKNVKTIGDYAFAETNMVNLFIPDCTTHIGKYAFYGCTFAREVEIGSGLTEISEGAFSLSAIQSCHLPKNITRIGANAFKNATYLKWVGLPSTITYIGDEAFQTSHLKTVYVSGKGPADAELGENIFPEDTEVFVPFDYEHLYRQGLSPWLEYDPHDWIPDDVENWDPEGPFGPYLQ